jgi:hypothetical protein
MHILGCHAPRAGPWGFTFVRLIRLQKGAAHFRRKPDHVSGFASDERDVTPFFAMYKGMHTRATSRSSQTRESAEGAIPVASMLFHPSIADEIV